ncbi:hypothetical protein Tco_0733556 [Tanacetum coccineum]
MRFHPKTKPLSLTIISANDESNFETITEIKWNLYRVKEWEMMLAIMKKKNGKNDDELKRFRKRYDDLRNVENFLVINLKKSLTLQDLTNPSSFQKKRKGIVEHELEQFIDGLYCNRALHEGVSFRDKIKALSVRIPKSPRLVKHLDELIKKREDMHFFLNKKAILESIGMEVEEKLKKEIL